MKKNVIAFAAVVAVSGFAHMAQAQEVSLYGTLDEAYRFSTNANAQKNSLNQITDGVQSESFVGVKGSEDLGNGLKAVFQLEAGFSANNGQSYGNYPGANNNNFFGRHATVGLADDKLGTVTVGRQNNLAYDFDLSTDVYGNAYGGANNIAVSGYQSYLTGYRWDSSLKYTNKIDRFNVGAQYSSGNRPGRVTQGSAYALAFGYATGPVNVQTVYQRVNDTQDTVPGSFVGRNQTLVGVGANYDFGGPAVFGQYFYNKFTETNQRNDILAVGASYPVTPRVTVKAAYTYDNQKNFNEGHRNTLSALADYSFSKRTNVYTEIDYNKFSGNYSNSAYVWNADGVPNNSVGFSMGLRHSF